MLAADGRESSVVGRESLGRRGRRPTPASGSTTTRPARRPAADCQLPADCRLPTTDAPPAPPHSALPARAAPPPPPPARPRCGRGSAPRAWRDGRSRPRRPAAPAGRDTATGRSPGWIAERYPASAARTRKGSRNGRPFTKSCVRRPVGRASPGRCAKPCTRNAARRERPPGPAYPASSRPQTVRSRSASDCPAGAWSRFTWSAWNSNPTAGCASASVSTASWHARVSLAAERRNFRRAGVLKKRPRTVTVVPRWRAIGSTRSSRPAVHRDLDAGAVLVGGARA